MEASPSRVSRTEAESGISQLLGFLNVDLESDAFRDTPKRVVKAFAEMCEGYAEDPAKILERQFDLPHDEMIVLRGVSFVSLCQHHMLPFIGTATVGYIPNEKSGKVVGLSKLARLVQCFAKRLQIQEGMTNQITDALVSHLDPVGCGAIVIAAHSCLSCRGIKQSNAVMVTSSLRGAFRNNPETRAEFLSYSK